ncbi:MAG: DUF4232 domain-containing protein [Mycobacterium sp.]|nr:DUF4232 domain-containing protein [Mycobacterium sp.]
MCPHTGGHGISEGTVVYRILVAAGLVVLVVGCSPGHTDRPAAPTSPTTPSVVVAAPSADTAPPATTVTEPAPQTSTAAEPAPQTSTPTEPAVVGVCSDEALTVSGGEVSSADTLRRVVVSFTNTGPVPCALVGYPGADLLTAAGGVLVHVARRPANSAPHLELNPGEVATADVQASAIDLSSGANCGRTGTLSVTPPNGYAAHLLPVNLPICEATISAVG